jgi:hypothetical protein
VTAGQRDHEQVREFAADGLLEPPERRRAMALRPGEGDAVSEEEFWPSPPVHGRASVLHTALSIDGPPGRA